MAARVRFDQPLTVAQAVAAIAADELLLPGIQRSFVWKPAQICTLFDSLLPRLSVRRGACLEDEACRPYATTVQADRHRPRQRNAGPASGQAQVNRLGPCSARRPAAVDGFQHRPSR